MHALPYSSPFVNFDQATPRACGGEHLAQPPSEDGQSSGWNVAVFIANHEVLNRRHLIWRELMRHVLRTRRAVVQLTLLFTSPGMVSRLGEAYDPQHRTQWQRWTRPLYRTQQVAFLFPVRYSLVIQ